MELQRLTTQYHPAEDRMCLSGLDASGQTHVLWLTRRLLRQLVTRMCDWLQTALPQQMGSFAAQADVAGLHDFAQLLAVAALKPVEPVAVLSAAAGGVCVQEVDITAGASIRLVFRGAGQSAGPAIAFEPQTLRQWLAILRHQWQAAEWPADDFPAWLQAAQAGNKEGNVWH